MRTYRPPRRLVVGLVAAVAIVLPTMPAFAAPGTTPVTPTEDAPVGGLPLFPDTANIPAPPAPAAPAPDVPYTNSTGCITPEQDQRNQLTNQLIERPYAQNVLQIDEAHQFANGAGQQVAVIDTGVNIRHSFFQNRARGAGDYVNDKNGTEDCDGHGTLVAGIIAGNTNPTGSDNPTVGFDGMAPEANILSIRQTSANYMSPGDEKSIPPPRTAGTLDTLAKAIVWAASMKVNVINISLTGCQSRYSPRVPTAYHALQSAIHWAVDVQDVVVVAAAGNLDADCPNQNGSLPESVVSIPMPPWFSEDVLSVASIDKNGAPSSFSIAGPWVSVAAPGEGIYSLSPVGTTQLVNRRSEQQDKDPHEIVGTSFAAPYVSGLVALVRQKFPGLRAREVMRRIEATAQHPTGPGGRDYQVGYGMINPVAALTDAVPGQNGVPIKPPAAAVPARIDSPYQQNWTPTLVALAGTGSGLTLLLITMFAVRTVRRNQRRREI